MCGFIGIYGPEGSNVAPEIYEGLLSVQHRGQDAAGITTFTDQFHVKKGWGLVLEVFNEQNMGRLKGNLGLGHVRYPTVGANRDEDAQPFHLTYPVGVAMAHNGNVTNFAELRKRLFESTGSRLNSSCDLEVILLVFAKALDERIRPGASVTPDDVFHAVQEVYTQVKGAYSVVATLPDVGMLCFRDPFGIKPITFGQREDEDGTYYACASESVVLDVAGYKRVLDIGPGEALFVDKDREVHRRKLGTQPHRPCVFELVYFARPDSMIDDVSVYKTRRRLGKAMGEQWLAEGAPIPDTVIPIPDSSREAALRMAQTLGEAGHRVDYREGLVKNRYIGRTFIMPSQEHRASSVRRKLNAIPLEFEGKDVLLVDDSIVRGTTARRIVRMAREAGARQVYFASCSPPLVAPCPYGIDMATKNDFVAQGKDRGEINAALESDYLMYLDRESMNAAVRKGNGALDGFCNACFTGEYPTGDITREVLEEIGSERENSQRIFTFSG